MNTQESDISVPVTFTEDDLLRLEMKVAKRADQLFQDDQGRPGRDLQHWLQAEHDVLRRQAPQTVGAG